MAQAVGAGVTSQVDDGRSPDDGTARLGQYRDYRLRQAQAEAGPRTKEKKRKGSPFGMRKA